MANIADIFKYTAEREIDKRGLVVVVKTDLGPEIEVYNSDDPVGPSGPSLVSAGIVIRDRQGKTITEYGGYPKTNFLKMTVILAGLSLLGVVLVNGVKN